MSTALTLLFLSIRNPYGIADSLIVVGADLPSNPIRRTWFCCHLNSRDVLYT